MNPLKRDREDFESLTAQKILLYQDAGTSDESVRAITNSLAFHLSHPIETVDSRYLKTKSWEDETFALVMGGGHCTPWEESLGQEGILKIKNFVTRGGRYLGICAGAYFAASKSLFHLKGSQSIAKQRPLAFFNGTANGPIADCSNHLSPDAALAVKINLFSQKGRCYYQGGCAFDATDDSETTRIIARYEAPYQGSCIIRCSVGSGKAILCGLHPEFLWKPHFGTSIPALQTLVQKLVKYEPFRQEVWKSMIAELL